MTRVNVLAAWSAETRTMRRALLSRLLCSERYATTVRTTVVMTTSPTSVSTSCTVRDTAFWTIHASQAAGVRTKAEGGTDSNGSAVICQGEPYSSSAV